MTEQNTPTNERDLSAAQAAATRYRRAFLVAFFAAIVLAIGMGLLWWRLQASQMAHLEQATASPPTPTATETPLPAREASPRATTAAPLETEPPLAPIQLTPQRMQSIGVQIGKVESKPANDELRFYGNVQANERRLAYMQTRFAGWIRKVYANATGEFVRQGQPLFTIYSPELVTTEQEYLLAKKNQALLQTSSLPGVASGATSLFESARQRLLQWQIPESEIAKLDSTGEVITDLTINSPVSGYITEKNALPNLYVQPETRLYTVADLSEVWVYAQVFQNDAGKIKPGDPAEVTLDAYPAKVFKGRVDYLLPQVDLATRTLPVRLVFPNPGLKLRPGMYVNVRLKLPLGRQVVIPASAAFHSGTTNLVFVYGGEGSIEPRKVELGSRVGDDFVVLKGLKPGEEIVTSANFLINSEAQLQAAAGAFVPPPPGAGAAAAMNPPAQPLASIELTTDPSPPRKGSNIVRV
jgi:Cu(I)/Ag(I) efflux system membrane fusion protein/cobalt-zinc-cadmium efflux system membrane fusion protein